MSVKIFFLILVAFFAFNIASNTFSISFSPLCGTGWIDKKIAALLFVFFAVLGVLTAGKNVTATFSNNIIRTYLNFNISLVIILSTSLTLALANTLKIPQSTSMITMFSFIGVGLSTSGIKYKNIILILSSWVLLPAISYLITYLLYNLIYPSKHQNLKRFEFISNKVFGLKFFSLFLSFYTAFSIGANNIANLIAPLTGSKIFNLKISVLFIIPFFFLGAYILGSKLVKTFSKDIIPIGKFSAPVVLLVSSTLLLIASILGLPFPFVQLMGFSIFAISSVKESHISTFFHNETVKRIYKIWVITPLIAMIISYTGGKFIC